MYNPFGLLMLFRKREFGAWWFETGTPSFLIALLMDRRISIPKLSELTSDSELLSAFDVDYIQTEALLFQTGYLTIGRVEKLGDENYFALRYPNREVEQSLNRSLLAVLTNHSPAQVQNRIALYRHLMAGDIGALRALFHALFAGIPHDWYRKNRLAGYEGYYASIFYCYFAALGLDLAVEDATSLGRIDLRLRLPGRIILFEFKVVEMEPEGVALAQLQAKRYADKYRAEGAPIALVGVEFSRESRNIVAFETMEVR